MRGISRKNRGAGDVSGKENTYVLELGGRNEAGFKAHCTTCTSTRERNPGTRSRSRANLAERKRPPASASAARHNLAPRPHGMAHVEEGKDNHAVLGLEADENAFEIAEALEGEDGG